MLRIQCLMCNAYAVKCGGLLFLNPIILQHLRPLIKAVCGMKRATGRKWFTKQEEKPISSSS